MHKKAELKAACSPSKMFKKRLWAKSQNNCVIKARVGNSRVRDFWRNCKVYLQILGFSFAASFMQKGYKVQKSWYLKKKYSSQRGTKLLYCRALWNSLHGFYGITTRLHKTCILKLNLWTIWDYVFLLCLYDPCKLSHCIILHPSS